MLTPTRIERLVFLFIAIMLLVLSIVLYSRMLQLINSYKLIDNSNEVQLNLERIFSLTKEAESGQRGFILIKDTIFLAPVRNHQKEITRFTSKIRELTQHNQIQQLNVNTLEYLVKYRFNRINFTLQKIDSITAVPNGLNERLTTGRDVMEKLRRHVNLMLAEEKEELIRKNIENKKYVNLTPKSLLFLTLFSLMILFASYYRINQQLKIKKHYADQLKQKNNELKIKNRELEKSNDELQSFNYVASHDLREPLRKIKTFISLIHKEDSTQEKHDKYLSRIDAITSHMQLLLDDLFSYSKVSMEEREMEIVDLNGVLTEVKGNIKEMIEDTHTIIKGSNLPIVKGVRFQLVQLFQNLLHNSIKYQKENTQPVV